MLNQIVNQVPKAKPINVKNTVAASGVLIVLIGSIPEVEALNTIGTVLHASNVSFLMINAVLLNMPIPKNSW